MINSRLSVAIHILSLLASHPRDRLTSEYIAGSVQTNPVVIRRLTGMLRKAGIVTSSPGTAGAVLTKAPVEITLLDVYDAVFAGEDLFSIHNTPNPDCQVGRNIQDTLDTHFERAEQAMKDELARQTLADTMEHLFA
ncbi:Rrf2 family transcriptional regulator [Salibacterium qingdaonense]|uniref:Transcriptional regulator, BadM/Rrf2 family n=1 Tax=Salibacterium qingdaonense TaxID=266892 RepID=A0A1I4HZ17_9BACI|nr:Rrf2 family transcriptional regulator [Salibacterium qingdaonense]SFL47398.1 transcriptional regulator, BadM/Rrf2 family [Salibacterium qingdaonense]